VSNRPSCFPGLEHPVGLPRLDLCARCRGLGLTSHGAAVGKPSPATGVGARGRVSVHRRFGQERPRLEIGYPFGRVRSGSWVVQWAVMI
jgi:hypothetical protein